MGASPVTAGPSDNGWQPMLEMVSRSACKPAPPLGSVAAKLITNGKDSDMMWAMVEYNSGRAFYPIYPQLPNSQDSPDFLNRGAMMRILHTMLRVADLEKSLAFYTGVLDMKLLRRTDYPEGKFTLAFVGFDDEANSSAIELTHNWGVEKYEIGNAFGHIAIEVADAHAACVKIRQRGGMVVREAGPMKHGSTVIAFVEDPDGYKIELIQRK